MAAAATASNDQQTFEPAFDLVQEEECDTLVLYLPGFTKEQLRVQLSKSGILRISGQRPLDSDGSRWSSFQKEFTVSSNCETNKIAAKFEGGILYVRQPKLIVPAATADPKNDENKPATPQTTPPPPQPVTTPPEKTTAKGDESDEKKTQQNVKKSTVEGEKDDEDRRGDGIKRDPQSVVAAKLDEYYMANKLRVARRVTMVIVVVLVAVAVRVLVRRLMNAGSKEAEN